MKKKIINTILGIILGMAFLYAAVFAVGQYHTDEEETKKELKIKVPKALTPYEIGEEVQVGDFLWKVSEAELIDNYEKLDDYYKQRKYLKAPQPNQQNPFVEEQRFLRVKFSVQNTNKKKEAEFFFHNWNMQIIGARVFLKNGSLLLCHGIPSLMQMNLVVPNMHICMNTDTLMENVK